MTRLTRIGIGESQLPHDVVSNCNGGTIRAMVVRSHFNLRVNPVPQGRREGTASLLDLAQGQMLARDSMRCASRFGIRSRNAPSTPDSVRREPVIIWPYHSPIITPTWREPSVRSTMVWVKCATRSLRRAMRSSSRSRISRRTAS